MPAVVVVQPVSPEELRVKVIPPILVQRLNMQHAAQVGEGVDEGLAPRPPPHPPGPGPWPWRALSANRCRSCGLPVSSLACPSSWSMLVILIVRVTTRQCLTQRSCQAVINTAAKQHAQCWVRRAAYGQRLRPALVYALALVPVLVLILVPERCSPGHECAAAHLTQVGVALGPVQPPCRLVGARGKQGGGSRSKAIEGKASCLSCSPSARRTASRSARLSPPARPAASDARSCTCWPGVAVAAQMLSCGAQTQAAGIRTG